MHEFILLKETASQRTYQLPKRCRVFPRCADIGKLLTEIDPIKLRDGIEIAEDLEEGIDKVCISDAHSHIERLVFPAFNVREISTGEVRVCHRQNAIAGRHTFLIHGGDSESVKPDAVYLRSIMRLNPTEVAP